MGRKNYYVRPLLITQAFAGKLESENACRVWSRGGIVPGVPRVHRGNWG